MQIKKIVTDTIRATFHLLDSKKRMNTYELFGYEVDAVVLCDTSVARGMPWRVGAGARKHVQVRSLFLHPDLEVRRPTRSFTWQPIFGPELLPKCCQGTT